MQLADCLPSSSDRREFQSLRQVGRVIQLTDGTLVSRQRLTQADIVHLAASFLAIGANEGNSYHTGKRITVFKFVIGDELGGTSIG